MGARGRQPASNLAVISAEGIITIRRPDPPPDLTEEQSEEWHAIVHRLAADHFPRETHGMLAQYCRHVVAARRISQLIQSCESGETLDISEYNQLLIMQEREGRAISSLATRMRLSQQSTYSNRKSKPALVGKRPWDKDF